jgi:hypothetical protein
MSPRQINALKRFFFHFFPLIERPDFALVYSFFTSLFFLSLFPSLSHFHSISFDSFISFIYYSSKTSLPRKWSYLRPCTTISYWDYRKRNIFEQIVRNESVTLTWVYFPWHSLSRFTKKSRKVLTRFRARTTFIL